MPDTTQTFVATAADAGKRLDQYLAHALRDTSRARVQHLIDQRMVAVDGDVAKASLRLRGHETITVTGVSQLPPLRAIPEDIPLDVVYEDDELIVLNKPAGMKVHAGAGATDDARNRGTLVNALLHRFGTLSGLGGALRPGIVHRLDRETSGLILVAKNDAAHRELSSQFAHRHVKKTYRALVHGWPKADRGTINAAISRDPSRRTRMTTRKTSGRQAISHYVVQRRIESAYGKFALLEVKIDTGRTHQIRVHLASLGHPVVGDRVYGAPSTLTINPSRGKRTAAKPGAVTPSRHFLHAAEIQIAHPRTGSPMRFEATLPAELETLLSVLAAK